MLAIKEYAERLRRDYRMDMVGSFNLPEGSLSCVHIADDTLFLLTRERDEDALYTKATIGRYDLSGQQKDDALPLEFSLIPIGIINPAAGMTTLHDGKILIYFRRQSAEAYGLFQYDIDNGQESLFSDVRIAPEQYPTALYAGKDSVYLCCTFSGKILRFSLDGILIETITAPDGFEAPIDLEEMPDGGVLVSYQQDFFRRKYNQFAGEGQLDQHHLVLLNSERQVVERVESSRRIFPRYVCGQEKSIFFLYWDTIVKQSKDGSTIFTFDFSLFIMKQLGLEVMRQSPSIICGCNQGMLAVAETTYLNKVYLFKI